MGALDFIPAACKFFRPYLEGRRQYVKYKSVEFKCFPASSGVPQRSNLGPLLILLYTDDIVNVVNGSQILLIIVYADDIKL